jgi:hypothetical protein
VTRAHSEIIGYAAPPDHAYAQTLAVLATVLDDVR